MSRYPTEAELILDIIRQVGVQRLSHFDGCACGGFAVRNVEVDIACGKGRDRGVWVSSHSYEYEGADDELRAVADEVATQIEECDGRGPVPRHVGEWSAHDARIVGGTQ